MVTCACLMPCAAHASDQPSKVVDIFNVKTGTWSQAALSQARFNLAATSLPDAGVAIFAGGYSGSAVLDVVDFYNVKTGTWSTATLSLARSLNAATSLPNAGVAIFAGGDSTSCDFCLRCWRMGARGMREL